MTFAEFLIQKYPLLEGKDLAHFHPPLSQTIADVDEWLKSLGIYTLGTVDLGDDFLYINAT